MRLLVCLPHAGSGPALFRHWPARFTPDMRILAPRLPGREDRFLEDTHATIDKAVSSLLQEIADSARLARDVTIFGHCLGAVLGYELARRWNEIAAPPIGRLIVSAAHPPDRPLGIAVDHLDDEALLRTMERMTGYQDPMLADAEMRDILMPAIRGDLTMHERYAVESDQPLAVPITCVRGRSDRFVSQDDVMGWQKYSHAPVEFVELPGNHMYVLDRPDALFALLARPAPSGRGPCC
ncbi:thioesterase II family protein [Sphingomonas sanguinis]|jgi:surfactin synthase thioesterase subunit|uniref:Thioesterase n=1 Tax=Sphingomonas sanguinis TaxID=33051 RepID=A0A7Y7QXA5_9SPHN|nr:alpha/beta fold hydrolase [Sphingomonas sanguinis]MBZ6383095.1 alpha/beta fold hydrolase [Sphingomonas sanguinis]NNG48177.1 thioesterase [Sphingomonas sanguinis]NNG54923.1 thioesterase [Sphingomonas sanguinis]NVP32392.1 thioesterase [Sphingomonas sanguinis]